MVKRAKVGQLYIDEAEGFLLDHALFSPPRRWPPLPPEPTQSARLQSNAKKMDWEGEASRRQPEEDKIMEVDPSNDAVETKSEGEANKERCVICLMGLRDRTIVGVCGHEFCFECIGVWSNQSRRCPLCSADMAPFLLHDLDNSVPTKFYLPPLPSRPVVSMNLPGPSRRINQRPHPEFEQAEPDELDLQIERRKEIYQHGLYCRHVGSNATTRYRPNPTPHEIANSPPLIQRATAFLRRELRVWSHADVEYLTTHILSLIKAVDVRSDVAIRLLAEYLDPPTNAGPSVPSLDIPHGPEHFAHELYCWLRSPFKELRQWDLASQYDSLHTDQEPTAPEPILPVDVLPVDVDSSRSESPEPRGRSSRKRSASRSISPSSSISRSKSPYSRSSRSRSRSRSISSYSPSPPPRPRRDPLKRDLYIPSTRRWDEGDFWMDPDYAEEQAAAKRRSEKCIEQRRLERERRSEEVHREKVAPVVRDASGMRMWGVTAKVQRVELLPDEPVPTKPLRAEIEEETIQPSLTIKGAAVVEPPSRRLTLRERLAKAKGETIPPPILPIASPEAISGDLLNLPEHTAEINAEDLLATSASAPPRRSLSGLKETVRARLRLRLKLEAERADLRHNIAESKAYELRRRLLEAKVERQAADTDAVLRKMDRLDRQKEVRRRLMVEKMLQAETEGEKRARELKERLTAEKRRKMLREVLLARKRESVGVMQEDLLGGDEIRPIW